MTLKFSNNGTSTLASSITSSQTTLTLQAGTGVRFPTLAASDYFMATLVDTAGNMEIVRVTARSADTLTATRGQEGTLARAFDAGSYIANHLTAGQLATFFNTDNDGAGSGLDADLLDGLQHQATNVPSSIVSRDNNGDFAARVITAQTLNGNVVGNATTATTATNVSGGTASVTSLTNTGASNLQGNVTLGTNTGNVHTVNGALTITGQTTADGGLLLARSGGEAQVMAAKIGAGASGFYIYNNSGQQGLYDTVQQALIAALKTGEVIVSAGSGVRQTALSIGADRSFSRVIPGGSTLYPDFACRAWVNFNGQGTVAIRGQGNVSSITDRGTGAYTVNLAAAMPDANYATHLCGRRSGTVTSGFMNIAATGEANAQYSATGVLVYTMGGDGSNLDYETVCVSILR